MQALLGFRIVGMRVYDPSNANACKDGFLSFSKTYGRSLSTREEVIEAFRMFLLGGTEESSQIGRSRSIRKILCQLGSIQKWFDRNTTMRFYSSSILIVYEGSMVEDETVDVVKVKMIDFGRVRREAGGDEGYCLGLKTVISMFEEIATNIEKIHTSSPT